MSRLITMVRPEGFEPPAYCSVAEDGDALPWCRCKHSVYEHSEYGHCMHGDCSCVDFRVRDLEHLSLVLAA
jgi:hypothetical protein